MHAKGVGTSYVYSTFLKDQAAARDYGAFTMMGNEILANNDLNATRTLYLAPSAILSLVGNQ